MVMRGLIRLSYTCRLQRRAQVELAQGKGKILLRSFASGVSFEEGSQVESKSATEADPDNVAKVSEASPSLNADDEATYVASVKVDVPFLPFCRGRRGRTKLRIENETKTQLSIPLRDEAKQGACLVVKGTSQEAVDAAVTQIEGVLEKAKTSPSLPYSHFISFPLSSHPVLVERVTKFRDSVLADEKEANRYVSWFPETVERTSSVEAVDTRKGPPKFTTSHYVDPDLEGLFTDDEGESTEDENDNDSGRAFKKDHGIDRSLFVKPTTFHLTLLMLKLWNEERIRTAVEVLQGTESKVLEALEGCPVKVHLKGMDFMRGQPAEAHVLYMRASEADQDGRLLRACQAINDAFIESGLLSSQDTWQEVKLHATLMNTAHRRRWGARPFDARQILIKHRSEDWGVYTITESHLSQRFAFDESGYYHCCGSIKFPSAGS